MSVAHATQQNEAPTPVVAASRRGREEGRAQAAVQRLIDHPLASVSLARQVDEGILRPGPVPAATRAVVQPFTGILPQGLSLRRGADSDRELTTRRCRGLARGNSILVGGPPLAPGPGVFASVFVHEAAHVASGASRWAEPPHFDFDDPVSGGWYEEAQRRRAELEAAETGPGREQTLARLPTMDDATARAEAPGIAYRAQDRGDVELARAAAGRLQSAWLDSDAVPSS